MKAGRRSSGFSLLEIMIAIVIIAFALMGILSATIHNSNAKESLRELEVAKQAADRKIDEIRSLPWGGFGPGESIIPSVLNTYVQMWLSTSGTPIPCTLNASGGVSPFTVEGLSNKKAVSSTYVGKGSVIIHGVHSNGGAPLVVYLIDLEVLIEWEGIRGPSRYSARTMMAKDKGNTGP